MGRWAQRVRAGGTVNNYNSMQSAVVGGSGSDNVTITYATAVGLNLLNPTNFQVVSGGEIGDNVISIIGNKIAIDFLSDVSGSSSLVYTGNAVGFLTPQTIALT